MLFVSEQLWLRFLPVFLYFCNLLRITFNMSMQRSLNMVVSCARHRSSKCYSCKLVAESAHLDKLYQSRKNLIDTNTISLSSTVWPSNRYIHSIKIK